MQDQYYSIYQIIRTQSRAADSMKREMREEAEEKDVRNVNEERNYAERSRRSSKEVRDGRMEGWNIKDLTQRAAVIVRLLCDAKKKTVARANVYIINIEDGKKSYE